MPDPRDQHGQPINPAEPLTRQSYPPSHETFAATLHGPKDLRWEQRPLGFPAPGRVHVRLAAGGICGSDLHYYRHGRSADFMLHSPLVLGHELAGIVAQVGDGVTSLASGARVAVNPSRACGVCSACRAGRSNLCVEAFFMGSASKTPHMQGGFASVFEVAESQCVQVGTHTPLEQAALAEPLAVALHAVTRGFSAAIGWNVSDAEIASRHRGDSSARRDRSRPAATSALESPAALRIAVFGAGPIGLMLLLALQYHGVVEVTMIDVVDAPLAVARRLGAKGVLNSASHQNDVKALPPFDLAFEASGSPAGLGNALGALRRGGALVQVGNLPTGDVYAPLNLVMSKELNLAGTFRFGPEFDLAVDLIDHKVIDVASLITARVPVRDARVGFEMALDREHNVKVVLVGDETSESDDLTHADVYSR